MVDGCRHESRGRNSSALGSWHPFHRDGNMRHIKFLYGYYHNLTLFLYDYTQQEKKGMNPILWLQVRYFTIFLSFNT